MKVDHRIKDLDVFIPYIVISNETFFLINFFIFGYTFFFSFIVVCAHLRCYTTSDVQLIMLHYVKRKKLKKLVNQMKTN